jgi:hypothetical protein
MEEIKSKFYVCNCGHEAVQVSSMDGKDNVPPEIFLSFWSYGHWDRGGLRLRIDLARYRLGLIWQIIRKGHPYLDSICLYLNDARTLGADLIELADDLEVKWKTQNSSR